MDTRVQCLDATVKDFRKTRNLADRRHRQALFLQKSHSAAGGYQLHAPAVQKGGELRQSILVRYAQKRAFNRQYVHTNAP